MIGGLVLEECLKNQEIGSITLLVRRSLGIASERVREIIVEDFTDYSKIEEELKNQDIAYYCLGVYTGTVPREEFRTITVDYTTVFADKLKKYNPDSTFCFLSGQGADQSEKSRMMFAKDKGIAENYLIKLNFNKLYIFRPAYIYPVTPRKEPNFTYKLSRKLYPLLKAIYPEGVIKSTDLAKAIFKTGIKGHSKMVLENKDIRKIDLSEY